MRHKEHILLELALRCADPGADPNVLVVELAGDWLGRAHLPDISTVTKELAGGGATALEFEAKELGRWDSALLVRILTVHDKCTKAGIEFRAQTLPAGLVKLIALSQAAPEKTDAGRKQVKPAFLEQVGESGLAAWTGGRAILSFLGATLVSLRMLLRRRAQFRARDLVEVVEPCGPQALGIVAPINFLVGLILAFVGAGQLVRFGASIYTADLVAVANPRELLRHSTDRAVQQFLARGEAGVGQNHAV